MFIMCMVEVYLIVVEVEECLGNGVKVVEYLNVFCKCVCCNEVDFEVNMKLIIVIEDDVLDEYVCELCGEFICWVLLK